MVEERSGTFRFLVIVFQVVLNYVLTWITIVGCSASIISLVICIVIFLTVPGRHFQSPCAQSLK